MAKWYSGKRKWALITAVIAVLAVVAALVVNQELVAQHTYPRDAIYDDSNISVRGTVTSIEENHKSQGYATYHIFRLFITLDIAEIIWISEDYTDSPLFSTENKTIRGSNIISIGYDNLDNPQLSIGQTVECKGYYLAITDSPYSFKITVAPSISESYLEPQG